MSKQWYYTQGGQKVGPLSSEQLRNAARCGQLAPSDLLWTDEMENWAPASTIEGLFPSAGPPAVPQADAGFMPPAPSPGSYSSAGGSRAKSKSGVPTWVKITAGVLGCLVLLGVLAAMFESEDVKIVKQGSLVAFPNVPVGKALDRFMAGPTWEAGVTSNGNHFVNVTGRVSYQGKNVKAMLQFAVDPTAKTFQARAVEFNDVPQPDLLALEILAKACTEYQNK